MGHSLKSIQVELSLERSIFRLTKVSVSLVAERLEKSSTSDVPLTEQGFYLQFEHLLRQSFGIMDAKGPAVRLPRDNIVVSVALGRLQNYVKYARE